MHPEEFHEMEALEESHWWFRGKRLLLEALLSLAGGGPGPRILDLGCGTGGVLQALAPQGSAVGIDSVELALRFCRNKGLASVVQGSVLELPFRLASFDVCVLMDVLEHVDDEAALLTEVRRVLRPGGAAVISVPAFQLLWSQHDVTFQHRRRYRRNDLQARAREAGLQVEWCGYTNFFVFLPALVWRVVRRWTGIAPRARTDFFRAPAVLNRVLLSGYRLEAAMLRFSPFPFGVSVACVARNA
jgi:SAM-dependent methyltransferase